jgi:outer membrane receptor protein involved in Fe transport
MTSKKITLSILAAFAVSHTATFAEEITLDPIVVSSDFRAKKLSQTSNSVTVIGEDKIYDKASQSFIETLASSPNVNFASGASKAKYIQIRGIGERSQFETPINPSVGLLIDGIDFSHLTLGATLFDIKQIEVLKGPQGTTFGANGLAGVITAQSNEPTKEPEGHLEVTVGNYNTKAFGMALSVPMIEDTLLGRFSLYQNSNDGYIKNSFLNKDNTNKIDEVVGKAHLRWLVSDNHTIDLNVMHININNGYDAFTLDNTWTSQSDQPGADTQRTNALALKSTNEFDAMTLISKLSYSKSDLTYSYDEDWSYVGQFDASTYPYMGFDAYDREKKQIDIDVHLTSKENGRIFSDTTDWTVGIYAKNYDEKLVRNHPTDYDAELNFNSAYTSKNIAAYAQVDTHLNDKLTVIAGLRVEKWDMEYEDSHNVNIENDEVMLGGKVGVNYQASDTALYYATLSRGYKPGGVNAGTTLSTTDKTFATETLWNVDLGANTSYYDNTLVSRFNLFYGKRKDIQIKLYQVDSHSFTDYLGNAAEGSYYGIESQLDYYLNDAVHIYSSIGLLKSEFDDYTATLNGRAPAHAPEYQYNIGFNYDFAESWRLKTNVEGKASYFFSNTHEQKSEAYTLLNVSLEYTYNALSVSVWAKNITDEEYAVRGFYFPNNPGNGYVDELYTQKGVPRTFGVTLSYDF